jgi:hypothetical protein
MGKVKEEDVILSGKQFKLQNYDDFSVGEIKYSLLTKINWMPIDNPIKEQIIQN